MIDEVAEEQLAELRAERDSAVQAVRQLRSAIRETTGWFARPGCCLVCDAWLATAEYESNPIKEGQ